MALELFFSHRDERGNSDFWMRHSALWADNGDTLSKIYAGTGALKSSFTRHGKMSLAGAIADARKSATRLYVNHFEDKSRQNTVDLLLGRLVGQNSVDLFDPVNDWVVSEVGRRRAEFETRDHIRIWMGTYNLNGKTAGVGEDLSSWLNVRGKALDIVVVGFQEIVELSPQQIMSTDPKRRMLWETAVRTCLNGGSDDDEHEYAPANTDEYVLLRSGQLVGAALLVFVRSSILGRIRNVEGAIKKTGMSGIAGNKGAVAIRMDVESTSVCFVTAHLAAGFGNYEERNRDYNTITSGLNFQRNRSIEDHEIVLWAGDFNYRIGLGYEKTKSIVNEAIIGSEKIRDEALGKLYENDQLNIQMVVGNCFNYYREGRVRFLPTYKYDLGKDEFDSSDKQRIPAWTDRILWKVNHKTSLALSGEDLGSKMKQLEYDSVMGLRFSDHRPVYATFEMGIRVIDEEKKDALVKKLYKKRAKEVKVRAGDSVEAFEEISSEGDDTESVMEYQSIQEGLPPASSDKRKWWLDGNKGARSTLRPPNDNVMLSKSREGNPWKETDEDDWVEVERPPIPDNHVKPPLNSGANSRASSRKPVPPPSRTTKRMVPPAWEGERLVPSGQAKVDAEMKSLRRPTPPLPRGTSRSRTRADSSPIHAPTNTVAATSPTTRPSIPQRSSSTATVTRKQPPPKPNKPTTLVSSSSQVALPQVSPLPGPAVPRAASISRSEAAVAPDSFPSRDGPSSGPHGLDGAFSDDRPPPLPRRTGTMSSTASFVSAPDTHSRTQTPIFIPASVSGLTSGSSSSSLRKGTPPPPPSRLTRLQRDASGSIADTPASTHGSASVDPAPALPPRTNTLPSRSASSTVNKPPQHDLLNDDDDDVNYTDPNHPSSSDGHRKSALDRYKPLLPS